MKLDQLRRVLLHKWQKRWTFFFFHGKQPRYEIYQTAYWAWLWWTRKMTSYLRFAKIVRIAFWNGLSIWIWNIQGYHNAKLVEFYVFLMTLVSPNLLTDLLTEVGKRFYKINPYNIENVLFVILFCFSYHQSRDIRVWIIFAISFKVYLAASNFCGIQIVDE